MADLEAAFLRFAGLDAEGRPLVEPGGAEAGGAETGADQ
jgi:hypothetical protein